MLAGGNVQKVGGKIHQNQNNSAEASADLHRIIKIPTRPPGGLEKNKLIYFGLH